MADGGVTGWVLLLSAGCLAGFCSGLLGIGGGSVIVPALIVGLPMIGVITPDLAKIAMATSMGIVVLTSLASAQAHTTRGTIDFGLWGAMAPSVVAGGLIASLLLQHISATLVILIYIVFSLGLAWRMAMKSGAATNIAPIELTWLRLTAVSLKGLSGGALATMVGTGVAFVVVPAITRFSSMPVAIGTASAIAVPMAIISSLGFLYAPTPSGCGACIGYVHPVVVAVIGVGSVLAAPLGALLTRRVPTRRLAQLFAFFLAAGALALLAKRLPELSSEAKAIVSPLLIASHRQGEPSPAPVWLDPQRQAMPFSPRYSQPQQSLMRPLDLRTMAYARLSAAAADHSSEAVPLPTRKPARTIKAAAAPLRTTKTRRAADQPAPTEAAPPPPAASVAPDLLHTLYGRP